MFEVFNWPSHQISVNILLDGVIPVLAPLKPSLADQLVDSMQENPIVDVFLEVFEEKSPNFLAGAPNVARNRTDGNGEEPQNLETKFRL